MKAINNWNEVKEAGDIEVLPAGGYVCRIEACTEKPNKRGGSHLEILFDVAEGDYRGFFTQDWKSQTAREDKFWRGIIRQNVPNEASPKYDQQCGFFKRFTSNVEKSNEGYHWDWNETGLKGKLIGVVFGEVERESSRGTRYFVTQADSVVSVQAIREDKFTVPPVRRLSAAAPATTAFADVDDGDLPF